MASQMKTLAHANVLNADSIVEVFACGHAILRDDLQTSTQQAEPGSHEIVYGPGPGCPQKHVSIYDVGNIVTDAARKCVSPLLLYSADACDLVDCQNAEANGECDALKQVVPFSQVEHARVDECENQLELITKHYMDGHRMIRNVHQTVLRTVKFCYLDKVAAHINFEVDELTGAVTARMFTDRFDIFVQGAVRTYTARMLDCVQNGSSRLTYETNAVFAVALLKLYNAKTDSFIDLACKIATVNNEILNRGLLGNESLASFIGMDIADLDAMDGLYDDDDDNIKREQIAMAILAPELATLDRVTLPKLTVDVALANKGARAMIATTLLNQSIQCMATLTIDTALANAPHQLEQIFGPPLPVNDINTRSVPFPPSNALNSALTWEEQWAHLRSIANTPLQYDVPGTTLVGLPGTYPINAITLPTPPPLERDPRDYIGRGGFILEEGPDTFTGWQPDLGNLFNPMRISHRVVTPEVSPTNVAFVDAELGHEEEMSEDYSEAFALDDEERSGSGSGSGSSQYTDVTESYCYDSYDGMGDVASGANAWNFDYTRR
jgi:hypothetical protein